MKRAAGGAWQRGVEERKAVRWRLRRERGRTTIGCGSACHVNAAAEGDAEVGEGGWVAGMVRGKYGGRECQSRGRRGMRRSIEGYGAEKDEGEGRWCGLGLFKEETGPAEVAGKVSIGIPRDGPGKARRHEAESVAEGHGCDRGA